MTDIAYIKQTKFYKDPTPDSHGNCMQAAVASLLGLQLDDVPNFIELPAFWGSFYKFMKSRGLDVLDAAPNEYPKDVYYLGTGPSARGCSHVCVYRNGLMVHDPHPSNAGLLSIDMIHVPMPMGSDQVSQ